MCRGLGFTGVSVYRVQGLGSIGFRVYRVCRVESGEVAVGLLRGGGNESEVSNEPQLNILFRLELRAGNFL